MKKLFKIGDTVITEGDAAIGIGGLVMIVIVSVVVCSFCYEWKHKKIEECARRCCFKKSNQSGIEKITPD